MSAGSDLVGRRNVSKTKRTNYSAVYRAYAISTGYKRGLRNDIAKAMIFVLARMISLRDDVRTRANLGMALIIEQGFASIAPYIGLMQ